MVNAHFIKRFFDLSGIDPNKTLNAKLVKELFGLAADAAWHIFKFFSLSGLGFREVVVLISV